MNVPELILASLIPTIAFIIGILYLRRWIPTLLQQALTDVGSQINETMSAPVVKRAMSILGSKSGDVRADKALVSRVSGQIVGELPLLGKILEQFDITPEEGLKLINDPMIGPFIQNALAKLQGQNLQGPSQGQYQQNRGQF